MRRFRRPVRETTRRISASKFLDKPENKTIKEIKNLTGEILETLKRQEKVDFILKKRITSSIWRLLLHRLAPKTHIPEVFCFLVKIQAKKVHSRTDHPEIVTIEGVSNRRHREAEDQGRIKEGSANG